MRLRPTDPSQARGLTAPAASSAASEENDYDTERSVSSAARPRCKPTLIRSSPISGEPDGTCAKRACQVFVARNAEDFGRRRAKLRRSGRLRTSPPASRRHARHVPGAVVAEIRLLRPAPRVRVGHAQDGTLAFVHFLATTVANEHGLPGQDRSFPGELRKE